jgi:Lon protease-like protein
MTGSQSPGEALEFSGRAPLFPLPNVVLFPQALLPLHIFEPRYRCMTADALNGEQLLAMALLQNAEEASEKAERPPIYSMVGLGRIVGHQQLPDGRYYVVLRGLARARVEAEVRSKKPYRVGQLTLCHEIEPDAAVAAEHRGRLLDRFCELFPAVKEHAIWNQVTQCGPSLGTVCDLLVSALPLQPAIAQQFLEELDVLRRCDLLWAALQQTATRVQAPSNRVFPPVFSEN